MLPLLLLAELNVTVNVPFLHSTNLSFLAVYLAFYGISFLLVLIPRFEKLFKFAVLSGMILFSMYQLWLFRDYPIIYQIMYINLALSMIYLNGYLIMFTGIGTAAITALGFIFWKDVFFPQVDVALANIPIILVLQATVVLWGAARIGVRFRAVFSDREQMKVLLQQNEQQLQLIRERNQALELYAKQVERMAVLEERNRMARELHDTMGHALTSMIAGIELLKHEAAAGVVPDRKRMDSLLLTAREGLEDVRNHVHMSDASRAEEPLEEALAKLTETFSANANVSIDLIIQGDEPYPLTAEQRIAVLRCVQESLTNAVRHGQAGNIQVLVRYDAEEFGVTVEDDGRGTKELKYGFGLRSMRERIEALQGKLQIVPAVGSGLRVDCRIPIEAEQSANRHIRILLAEDQELVAESISIMLGLDRQLEVIGVAANGEEAIELCKAVLPDVVLMDIQMPVLNGLEATRIIKQRWPEVRIIILTTFQDIDSASLAIQYGAEGYLMKSVHPKRLTDAIRLVAAGGTIIPLDTAKLLIQDVRSATQSEGEQHGSVREDVAGMNRLTARELEILNYLTEGLKYREIAERMHYSEGTVKNYVSTIYSKLEVENRLQAIKKVEQVRGV